MTARNPVHLPSGIELTRAVVRCGAVVTYAAQREKALYRVHEFAPIDVARQDESGQWIPSGSSDAAELFRRGQEAFASTGQALRSLNVHRVLTPDRIESARGTVYWVTHEANAHPLRRVLRRRRLGMDELVRIATETLALLEQVHRAGLMHLGLTPDAPLLGQSGEVYLDRFGGWHMQLGPDIRKLPNALPTGFTPPELLHPEQFEQGRWTDVYGLAATLYWACTANPPQDVSERLRIYDATGMDPSVKMPRGVPPAMGEALRCALALQPEARPQAIEDWRAIWRVPERIPGQIPGQIPERLTVPSAPLSADDPTPAAGRLKRLSSGLTNAAAVAAVVLLAASLTVGIGSGVLKGPIRMDAVDPALQRQLNADIAWAKNLPPGTFSVELFRTAEPRALSRAIEVLGSALDGQALRVGRSGSDDAPVLRIVTGQFSNRESADALVRALRADLPPGYAAVTTRLGHQASN